ncbi:MAG: 5-formyltetrahydrofolate cyclo-ligase [Clostridia bacterium]|nr:5-formyltetrahydrofolate cyclo-ligase [Clostridia bacterium]
MDKTGLRSVIGARKRALTSLQIERASARLTRRFLATDAYRSCRTLFGYCSYNQEVRTEPILLQALKDEKTLALPRIFGRELRFLIVEDLKDLRPNRMGIPEPCETAAEASDEHALILMPGLAFDPSGRRLGYGGGYYDRYLARHTGHTLIALCYDFQLLDGLDGAPHDVPVDMVISEDTDL